jgi:hypothetical protein
MTQLRHLGLSWLVWAAACSAAGPTGRSTDPAGAGARPHPTQEDATGAPPLAVPSLLPPDPSVSTPTPPPDGPGLERIYTGQDMPTVVVVNVYPRAQYVFIDSRPVGSVAPGASDTFDVPLGVHTVTSADSVDGEDNATSITEPFDKGYRYRYEIRGR